MIHYIFAAAFGALIGSQSKKSKKSYADGGLIVSWFDKDINYQSKRFDTKKMEDAKRFFYQKQSEYLKPTLTTYDNDVILDSTYAKGGKMFVPQGREILYQDENVALQHNKVSDHYSMINPETGRYMAKGGEVSSVVNNLQKGDLLKIKFGSIASRDNEVSLKVRSRNKIRNGRIDKITFENVNNPDGARFYAYERGNGVFSFAMGDLAISNIEIVSDYAKGGVTEHGLQKGDTIIEDIFWTNKAVVKPKKGEKIIVDLDKGKRFADFAKGGKTLPRPAKDFIAYVIDMDGNATLKYSKTFQGANRMMQNMLKKNQDVSTHGVSKYDPFYGTWIGKMFFEPIKGFAKGGKMQGYNARGDEELGMTDGKESRFQQSKKDRRDEMKGENRSAGNKTYGSFAKGGEVSKYKTGITKYGKNQYAVRVDIGDKELIPKLLNDRWDSKEEAEAFAKRLAKRNNGTYVGEDGLFAKGGETDFIQQVVNSPDFRKGAFTKKAKERGLTPEKFMRKVLKNPDKYDERTRKQAQFMKNITD